ncbi:MAG TPA: hypothetical protein GX498_09445 [Clostridiales bacterium]|nr:hypothetical protein [Clostridiales bacterium]
MSWTMNYMALIITKDGKFNIYFEKSALYCKMIDLQGNIKETMLINGVYQNFHLTKSHNDSINLLCQSINGDYMLLTYDSEGWHIEELSLKKDFGTIIPLGIFALINGICIVFAKKLLVESYYDLFLLTRENNEWKKSFICEIYSKTLDYSQFIKMSDYNNLHLISALSDGNILSLKYYNYDASILKWSSTPIVNLNGKDVFIKTSISNNILNLFCYDYTNDILNVFCFSKHLNIKDSFSLVDIIKLNPAHRDVDLTFNITSDNLLRISYRHNNYYYNHNYSLDMKKWINYTKIPVYQLPPLFYVKKIESNDNNLSEIDEICSLDNNLELILPYEKNNINENTIDEDNKQIDNSKILLDLINVMSEKLEALNLKLNHLEEKKIINTSAEPEVSNNQNLLKPIQPNLKQSNFREKFMKYKPTTLKLESTTLLSGKNEKIEFISSNNIENSSNNIDYTSEEKFDKKEPFPKEDLSKTSSFIKSFANWFRS